MPAITGSSLGYAGEINELTGRDYWNRIGASKYGVVGAGDLKVSTTTGDRMLLVASGIAWGHNIEDTLATSVSVQLNSVASGSRWDMVVVRRDVTAKTSIEVVQGTGTKALPSLTSSSASHADQPLALCRVEAGSTTVAEIIDLRCWAGNGTGLVAADDLARTGYLTLPGARVMVGSKDWAYLPAANNTFAWVDLTAPGADVVLWYGNGSTAYSSQPTPTMRMVSPGHVRVEGVFKPGTSAEGASLLSIPTGNRTAYAPTVTQNKKVAYRTTSSTYGIAFAQVQSGGAILFYGLPSNTDYVELGFGWFV